MNVDQQLKDEPVSVTISITEKKVETQDTASPKAIVEALLFISEKPLLIDQIKGVLDGYDPQAIRQILMELKGDYENSFKGLRVEEIAGGFQISTSHEVAQALKNFYKQRDAQRLSVPALETLAIIAYKQPLTRLDIESLRGVNVDGVIRSLMDKGLIRISGRKDVIGRPFVYSTTRQFLEYFGLSSLDDLPKVEDFTNFSENITMPLILSNRQNTTELLPVAETGETPQESPQEEKRSDRENEQRTGETAQADR